MPRVVNIEMRVEGMLVFLDIEFDDGTTKTLMQEFVPPPLDPEAVHEALLFLQRSGRVALGGSA